VGRSAGQAPLEHAISHAVEAGRRRVVVVTGAGGQLGTAVAEAFADVDVLALARSDWDVTQPYPDGLPRPDLVLHAAAWTDVDGAESHPDDALGINGDGTRNVVALGAPVVYFSSDYIFDGEKRTPYVESDEPNPLSVYGRSKLAGEQYIELGWVVRTSWLYGPTGHNFVRTVLQVASERDELTIVDDQTGCPTYVGHLAEAVRTVIERPYGIWHLAADGECTWFEFAQEIAARANLSSIVRPVSTRELGRPAPRPAYSVLRSERTDAPRLPHWRDGVRACLERLGLASR
jgi:dTDP-4-dehydrorhamnose reductase